MWRRDPTYRGVVETTWAGMAAPENLCDLSTQLGTVSRTLQQWDRSTFGSVRQELCRLRKELEDVRRSSLSSGPTRKERHLMSKLFELLTREEIMEKQRARIDWLKEGDRNTAFFQAKSRERVRVNRISALKHEDGSIVSTQEAIETTAMDFYANLFTRQEMLDPGPVLEYVAEKVSPEMNEILLKPYTATLGHFGPGCHNCGAQFSEWR
jgi:hypothetical protein